MLKSKKQKSGINRQIEHSSMRFAPPFLLFAICTWCVTACAPRLRTEPFFPDMAAEGSKPPRPDRSCGDWRGYLPDTAHSGHLPVRHLRVNFHVMNSADSTHNFRPDEGRAYLKRLFDCCNEALDTNHNNWRSKQGTPVLPRRYRYVLTPQPGDDGIYFHYDDSLYYFISQGKNQNNYSRKVIDKYAVGKDSIINIFVMVHPDDSIRSKTYRAGGQGIALGTSLKVAGIFETKEPPENFDGLINHEVGHILGLSHAWIEDGCPDTDHHPAKCWAWTPEPPCNELASNNMMDYNAYQIAQTPCQIARIQAVFANERSPVRRCLLPTWCTRNPSGDIVIRDSVSWTGARDLEGNITIAPGGALRIHCRVSIPEGGRITVEPGGRLWLDGARLHNACGRKWEGVFVQTKGGLRGEVFALKPPVFENCPVEKTPRKQKK
ncbi:MAG: hypothetical protein DYG98_05790 [Haliscomenobacteraceae bacterium CHB4]|nr:hypothetical protein [Haliscomenobacteraceae bacterium CHB4]